MEKFNVIPQEMDGICIYDVRKGQGSKNLKYPSRHEGFLIILCVKGNVRMSVNLNECELKDNTLLVSMPGNIVKIDESERLQPDDMRFVILSLSQDFMQEIRIELNKIFAGGISLLDYPVLNLDDEQVNLALNYLSVLRKVISSEGTYKRESAVSLLSSVFYLLAGAWTKSQSAEDYDVTAPQGRGRMIFDQFIRLVSEHHMTHRNVGFYADKLCLTPKYLSKLIKNATGRSAPDWIDSYVILEAKNMLKYSPISIKEIVYRLNFSNQSVFYKFFKARTGMTPSEYRSS